MLVGILVLLFFEYYVNSIEQSACQNKFVLDTSYHSLSFNSFLHGN